jgi:hypothetical protein
LREVNQNISEFLHNGPCRSAELVSKELLGPGRQLLWPLHRDDDLRAPAPPWVIPEGIGPCLRTAS